MMMNPTATRPDQEPSMFIAKRLALFESLWAKRATPKAPDSQSAAAEICITCENSAHRGKAFVTLPIDLPSNNKSDPIVAKVNGVLWDLNRPLESDCQVELLTWSSFEAQHIFWHSSAHILGTVLEKRYGAMLFCGPPLGEGGFFQDSAFPPGLTLSPRDYPMLEEAFAAFCHADLPFQRLDVTREEAMQLFAYNKYKLDVIESKVPVGGSTVVYRCGDSVDLCRGPHIPSTRYIKSFKVFLNSASYWKGDPRLDHMQRIYAISFPTSYELKAWTEARRRMKECDHRTIGKQQEIFMFLDEAPGCCVLLPHGARIYRKLEQLILRQYALRGFTEVMTPNILNVSLWKTSGHWDNFKDNMFSLRFDDQDWAMKPMNCPVHCLIFSSKQRSYRDLPIRYADFGVLHRNELSGALTGLTRVRKFQQDDAHIFCLPEQIEREITNAIHFIKFVYSIFQFAYSFELSTMPENHLGDIETWRAAEEALSQSLNAVVGPEKWKLNPGDGAFYGPKIDVHITDSANRSHQCGTIQLDFQLPERFDLKVFRADSSVTRPVIIHRAIFGSFERFIALLIEHTEGRWPFWISPRQCIVIPVTDDCASYAATVQEVIVDKGYFCDLDNSSHLLNKKIRNAQVNRYNYIIVLGSAELKNKTVNLRNRDGIVHGEMDIDKCLEKFDKMVEMYQ